MNDRVIEPSEIILENPHKPRENITHVNPWIRCIARFFDYSLFCLLLLFLKKLLRGFSPVESFERFIPFEYFFWIPIEALLLSTWGKTPGKFFLKTRLKAGKRTRLHFQLALKRSFNVWLRGFGMGIIGLNFFCLALAYQKLKILKITSWDREDHIEVTHYPIGRWRIYVAVFVAVTGLFLYMQDKSKESHYVTKKSFRSIDEHSPSKIFGSRSHLSAQNSGNRWSERK